jgi:hypothetical protein
MELCKIDPWSLMIDFLEDDRLSMPPTSPSSVSSSTSAASFVAVASVDV